MKRHYPGGVKYLVFFLLLIGVWNLIRFLAAISFWNLMSEYHIRGGPLYIGISGAVWAMVAFYVCYSVLHARPWAWGMTMGLLASYGAWILFDQQEIQVERINQYFVFIESIFWLLTSCIVLLSKSVRIFFHEQPREN